MNDTYKVSVVIPVYNCDKTIKDCIKSLLNQTYSNMEIIIVDDGSTDMSWNICNEIVNNTSDMKIVLVRNEHKGVVVARNIGISAATGEYITFVDADDYIEKDCIEKMVAGMQNVDFCMTGIELEYYDEFDKHIEKREIIKELPQPNLYEDDSFFELIVNAFRLDKIYMVNVWGKLFKTSKMQLVASQISDQVMFGEDCLIVYLYALQSRSMRMLNNTGYKYRYCEKTNDKKYNINLFSNITQLIMNLNNVAISDEKLVLLHEKVSKEIISHYLNIAIAQNVRGLDIEVYYYPYWGRLNDCKVVLYGAGNVGCSYYKSMLIDKKIDLIAWIDKNAEKIKKSDYLPVRGLDYIKDLKFDYIIVAVFDESKYLGIKNELVNLGIEKKKILWSPTRKALLY